MGQQDLTDAVKKAILMGVLRWSWSTSYSAHPPLRAARASPDDGPHVRRRLPVDAAVDANAQRAIAEDLAGLAGRASPPPLRSQSRSPSPPLSLLLLLSLRWLHRRCANKLRATHHRNRRRRLHHRGCAGKPRHGCASLLCATLRSLLRCPAASLPERLLAIYSHALRRRGGRHHYPRCAGLLRT